MLPTALITSTAMGKSVAIFLSVLLGLNSVVTGETSEYYNEMPVPTARDAQTASDQLKTSRLLDLLQLKQSMSDLLPPNTGSPGKDLEENIDSLEGNDVSKRVFCNGFTGCGGRFRGRRRQAVSEIGKRRLPSSTKRPFCNTYGCYNSGKRSFELASDLRDDPSEVDHQRVLAFADGWSGEKMKKLFCNGYGGCQNMGKRLTLLSSAMSRARNEGDPRLLPFSKGLLGSSKRFFSSGFDDDVDDLVDSLKR